MLEFILFAGFFVLAFLMLFAPDSYINKELAAYDTTIVKPWIPRLVALKYSA